MELCCGALINMGETVEQRVELLTQLQELAPTEVPLNFLNPRPGTPLGGSRNPRSLGGRSLDRAVPSRPPFRHPALCRRA